MRTLGEAGVFFRCEGTVATEECRDDERCAIAAVNDQLEGQLTTSERELETLRGILFELRGAAGK